LYGDLDVKGQNAPQHLFLSFPPEGGMVVPIGNTIRGGARFDWR
jgi:hypothetical protein